MNRLSTIVVIVLALSSCTSVQEESAFERTIEYYRQSGDTLKMLAAQYLRDNARWHYGVSRHFNKPFEISYTDVLDRPETNKDSVFKAYIDSCGYSIVSDTPIYDIDTITDSFLRENIDLAFDSWNKPWSKDIPFNDFCKYILPYRNADEELSSWRKFFKERYETSIIDSVADPASLPDVINYLMRCIRCDVEYGGSMGLLNRYPLSHDMMMKLHWLECLNCANFTTLAMRACGVPCSMIEIHWRFTEVTHLSVLFPKTSSISKAFRENVGDTLIYMGAPKDTMAAWRVWEYDYELNKEKERLYNTYKHHDLLRTIIPPLTQSDITSLLCKTYNFSLPIPDSLKTHPYLFLCRFHDHKWQPIREGIVDADSVRFRDATIRQWYRLGHVDDDTIRTIGTPFTLIGNDSIIDTNHRIRYYDCTGDTLLFRIAYRSKVKEGELRRPMTTWYWDEQNQWHAISGEAILWGFNPKTGEYRIFDETLRRKGFRPDFHLFDVRVPKWTVFYDKELGSPFGYIDYNPETNEGYLMQF